MVIWPSMVMGQYSDTAKQQYDNGDMETLNIAIRDCGMVMVIWQYGNTMKALWWL